MLARTPRIQLFSKFEGSESERVNESYILHMCAHYHLTASVLSHLFRKSAIDYQRARRNPKKKLVCPSSVSSFFTMVSDSLARAQTQMTGNDQYEKCVPGQINQCRCINTNGKKIKLRLWNLLTLLCRAISYSEENGS